MTSHDATTKEEMTMSTIRDYLEEKLETEGSKGWLKRDPRETTPEILELVREFRAGGGFYDDDAELYLEAAAGDLPEHHHHGHDDRHPLTYQLGHEIYIAKGLLRDEALRAELEHALADGFQLIAETELEPGKRYTLRTGTLYVGQSVPSFAPADSTSLVRAVEHADELVLLHKGARTNGFRVPSIALVREGWDA